MLKKTLILFLFAFLASCTKYKLSDEDLKCVPYNGNEKLYFKSSYGDVDSFILDKPDRYFSEVYSHKLIDFDNFEIVDFYFTRGKPDSSFYSPLVRLQAAADDIPFLTIYLIAKDAKLEPEYSIGLDEYKKQQTIKLSTAYGSFSDVLIFYPDATSINYEKQPEYITKVYWSKSKGLLRFDKKDCYWELSDIKIK